MKYQFQFSDKRIISFISRLYLWRLQVICISLLFASFNQVQAQCVGSTTSVNIPRNIGCSGSVGSNAGWDGSVGGTINDQGGNGFTVTWTSTGTFRLKRTFPNGGCMGTTVRYSSYYTVVALPFSPTPSPASRVGIGTVTLNGTAGSGGSTLRWYDALTAGNLLATATSYTTSIIGITTTYYITSYNSITGCESTPRVAIAATVVPENFSGQCVGSVSSVNIPRNIGCSFGTGGNLDWDGAVGGNIDEATSRVTWTAAGTFRLKRVFPAGCTGTPLYSSYFTIAATPSNPAAINGSRCGPGSVALSGTLGSNATTLRWYDNATTLLATGINYTTPSISATTTYWVSSYNSSTTCESGRTPVTATVNSIQNPFLTAGMRCGEGNVNLSGTPGAGGTTLRWYDAPINGTRLTTATSYSPYIAATTNYWVSSFNVSTTCESKRIQVTAIVNPNPILTSATNAGSLASGSTFRYTPTSSISGSTFNWSRAFVLGIQQPANSGTGSVNELLTNTTTSPINVTYLFSATANGCTGPTATVTVAVNPISNNYNYIITRDLQSDRKANGSLITEADIASLPVHLKAENTTYFDGLGRPMQSVATQASPINKQDIVTPITYDDFGRENIKYLPYVSSDMDGFYKPAGVEEQAAFYTSPPDKVIRDLRPFSETIFEPSPLNRPLRQFGPGQEWKDANKALSYDYLFNITNEVYLFRYDATSGLINWAGANNAAGFYDAGELYANKTTDEQGHEVIEYVDKEGRTICKKVEASVSGSSKVYASTYYIYDDMGNLAVVLPPEGVKQLTN